MNPEEIERLLGGLRIPEPGWGLRTRILACAGERWILSARARLSFRRWVRRWIAAASAALLVSGWAFWREETLTTRCLVSCSAGEKPEERALRAVCDEAGLNHGYAARWAHMLRDRRAKEPVAARLWREMAVQ